MEIPHIPRRARLRFRIGNSSNGAEREPYHHAAPDQVGENIPEDAVERQQRHAERRRKPRPAAAEVAFLQVWRASPAKCAGRLRSPPSRIPTHKRPAVWYRTAADTASSRARRGQSSRRSTTSRKYACLPAFAVGNAGKQRADERDQQLQQVLNQLHAASSLSLSCPSSRFICRSRKHKTVTHTPSKKRQQPDDDVSQSRAAAVRC